MKYEIVELENFSGSMATIYSVIIDDDVNSLFDYFLNENENSHEIELENILKRLFEIGHSTGAREKFFKINEGKPGDGVCALYDDPESRLRLYCIRYGSVAIILGGGGPKSKDIKSWQEDVKLEQEATEMINLSANIILQLTEGQLKWSTDGKKLIGNLTIKDDKANEDLDDD